MAGNAGGSLRWVPDRIKAAHAYAPATKCEVSRIPRSENAALGVGPAPWAESAARAACDAYLLRATPRDLTGALVPTAGVHARTVCMLRPPSGTSGTAGHRQRFAICTARTGCSWCVHAWRNHFADDLIFRRPGRWRATVYVWRGRFPLGGKPAGPWAACAQRGHSATDLGPALGHRHGGVAMRLLASSGDDGGRTARRQGSLFGFVEGVECLGTVAGRLRLKGTGPCIAAG